MKIADYMKNALLTMLEPPWRHSVADESIEKAVHHGLQAYKNVIADQQLLPLATTLKAAMRWISWVLNWTWFVAGLFLGAFIAPSLLRLTGLAKSSYQDYAAICVAAIAGFLVYLFGWFMMGLADWASSQYKGTLAPAWAVILPILGLLLIFLPFAGVGYGLYRYLTWVGPGQARFNIAFTGALFIKMLVVPGVRTLVTNAGFKRFMEWLRRKP